MKTAILVDKAPQQNGVQSRSNSAQSFPKELACQAQFWRPSGLGNRLFSWARAVIYSHNTRCRMVAPTWAHLRGGSIIRGGIDYSNALRKILLVGNFRVAADEISGLENLIVKTTYKKHAVINLSELAGYRPQPKTLITFLGHTGHVFDELWDYRELILGRLVEITRKKWLKQADAYQEPFIGINVRMGNDFKKNTSAEAFKHQGGYLQTPLDWYVKSLRLVRQSISENVPAVIVSDGSEADLEVLLREPNTQLAKSDSAISDLLILAKSRILLGAGRSTFSAWASFLSCCPTFTIPGSSLQGYHVSKDMNGHFVGELDPDQPGEAFEQTVSNWHK